MTTGAKPNPIPDTYRRVNPVSSYRAQQRPWTSTPTCSARPSGCGSPGPGGTIAHSEIQIGDAVVIVEDEDRHRGTTAPPAGGLAGTPCSSSCTSRMSTRRWHARWSWARR
jgi:PhnB protein